MMAGSSVTFGLDFDLELDAENPLRNWGARIEPAWAGIGVHTRGAAIITIGNQTERLEVWTAYFLESLLEAVIQALQSGKASASSFDGDTGLWIEQADSRLAVTLHTGSRVVCSTLVEPGVLVAKVLAVSEAFTGRLLDTNPRLEREPGVFRILRLIESLRLAPNNVSRGAGDA